MDSFHLFAFMAFISFCKADIDCFLDGEECEIRLDRTGEKVIINILIILTII